MRTTDTPHAAQRCVFAKAVLAGQGSCPLATMVLVGEAQQPRCVAPVARTNCATLHALLRERATFALRLAPGAAELPHAQEMRLQCGGLRGLAAALGEPDAAPADIHRLVVRARATWGGLLGIPYAAVVAAIVQWQGRTRAAHGGGSP